MLLQLIMIIDWQAPVHNFGCEETLIEFNTDTCISSDLLIKDVHRFQVLLGFVFTDQCHSINTSMDKV